MRKNGRVSLTTQVVLSWIAADGSPKYVRGRVMDASLNGLRIEISESIAARTLVGLRVEELGLSANASVRHVTRSRGKYIVGLEFNSPAQGLLDKLVAAVQANGPMVAK
jgi:hypothetical protein